MSDRCPLGYLFKVFVKLALKRLISFLLTTDEKLGKYASLVDTQICFSKNSTQATQLILLWFAITQLSLNVDCNNSELLVKSLCRYLQVLTRAFIYNGYLPNSLKTAILDDFLCICDIYFKNFICNLSHRKFSAKFSSSKSAFLILDD